MKISSLFTLFVAILVFSACQGNSEVENDQATVPAQEASSPTVIYPSIPVDTMQMLSEQVDAIDYVFYYLDFSMNQTEPASVRATLASVATEAPAINPSCQPMGSLFFNGQGKELAQAELYFQEDCLYYIWLVNGQRTFANKMTAAGLQFYQRVFAQAQQIGQ